MPREARVGDKVASTGPTCTGMIVPVPWTGIIMTGAQTLNNRPAARVTDKGNITCPFGSAKFIITKGSGKVSINGQKVARMGDMVTCLVCGGQGKIIEGSNNTKSGG